MIVIFIMNHLNIQSLFIHRPPEDLYDVVLYKKQKNKRKEKYVKLFLSNDFFPLLDEFHQLKIDKIQVLTI